MNNPVARPLPSAKPVLPPSRAFDLAGLVDYVPGSIVSKVLGVGTITLFAFDAGQQLTEHTTPMDALVQVLDGQATIVIAGVAHVLGAGEIILMPAQVPHAVRADSAFKMLLTMFRS